MTILLLILKVLTPGYYKYTNYHLRVFFVLIFTTLTLFKMGIIGAAHWSGGGGWGQKDHRTLPKICPYKSYNDETRHSYTLSKENPKNYELLKK